MADRSLKALFVLLCVFLACPVEQALAAEIGTVSGNITINGMPLESGKVTFYRENGQFAGSKFKGGKFSIDSVIAGTMTVVVEGKGVPAKYTSEETSPLRAVIVKGKNQLDFDLQ